METINTPVNGQTEFKAPRFRSVAYPSISLASCISLVENLYKLFGNSVYIPREKISEKTGISDSHLQTQLSSCVQHGLLELKSKEGYKPTDLFIKIYKPRPNEKVRSSKIQAFKNSELYAKLVTEHDKETHTVDSLATLLFRDYKVSDNASQLAARIFIENAKELGLIDEENFLNLESDDIPDEVEVFEEKETPPAKIDTPKANQVTYLPPPKTSNPKTFDFPPIPIFVDDEGSVAEVYLPKGFNKAHIQKIINVLEAQIK